MSNCSSGQSTHESEWQEEEEEQYEFYALHSTALFGSLPELFEYEKREHDFDFNLLKKEFALDLYGCIKLVNYVRATKGSVSDVRRDIQSILSKEKYLQPVLENDAILFHLVEDEDEQPSPSSALEALQEKYQDLQSQYVALQTSIKTVLDKEASVDEDTYVSSNGKKPDNDTYYFNSYGYSDIHETMLKDSARTSAYRDFCYDNKDLFAGKVVLDVGCGTGILSMFASKAGAKHVFAVDNSNIIDKARAIAYDNGLDEKITFVKGKVESIELPRLIGKESWNGKVDIIISEWMGFALLYESMLDSVLCARDRFLQPGGVMAPSCTTMLVAGISDKDYFDDRVNFWNDQYGFNMRAMKDDIFDDVLIDYLSAPSVGTEVAVFKSLDLHQVNVNDLEFTSSIELSPLDGKTSIVAFSIWFDTFFTKTREASSLKFPVLQSDKSPPFSGSGNAFTTGPFGIATHWKQATLLLDREVKIPSDHKLVGELTYAKDEVNHRALKITLEWSVVPIASINQSFERVKQVWRLR